MEGPTAKPNNPRHPTKSGFLGAAESFDPETSILVFMNWSIQSKLPQPSIIRESAQYTSATTRSNTTILLLRRLAH